MPGGNFIRGGSCNSSVSFDIEVEDGEIKIRNFNLSSTAYCSNDETGNFAFTSVGKANTNTYSLKHIQK